MGEVGDHGAVHLEVDLDGRAAQLGMRGGAGVGCGEPSQPGDIAGQFDDALVVDVVQHKVEVSGLPAAIALGERGLRPYIWAAMAEIQSGRLPAAEMEANSAAMVLELWDSGVRRQTAPSAGDTPVHLGPVERS